MTTLQLFAQDMYRLLLVSDGRLLFTSLEAAYLRMFGTAIQPAVYGYQSVIALLTSISHTVLIINKPPKRYIELNKELASKIFYTVKSNYKYIILFGIYHKLKNFFVK